MTDLPIRIDFHSDWVVGSGHARHDSVDLLVRRDADGLPFVPGKTLRGIWRDAAEVVAFGLDDGKNGAWSAWSRYLWGASPGERGGGGPGALVVSSARIPADMRARLLRAPELVDAAFVYRSATAIEDATGCALDDTLRLEERGRAGCSLEATVEAVAGDADVLRDADCWPARFLLLASARTARRLGGRRRRGAGRCTLIVNEKPNLPETWEEILGWVEGSDGPAGKSIPAVPAGVRGNPRRPVSPDETAADNTAVDGSPAPATDHWRRAVVDIVTIDPVLVGARVLGNAVLSHPMIPASVLLPVVTRALGADASIAVRGGDLLVTDANPALPGDTERSLPAPMCFRRPKVPIAGQDDLVVNAMRDTLIDDETGRARQTVGVSAFVTSVDAVMGGVPIAPAAPMSGPLPAARLTHRAARLTATTHNAIDDATQRPGLNGLYSYEAVAEGSTLTFEIWIRGRMADNFPGSLAGAAMIGASLSAEYGRVVVTPRTGPAPHGLEARASLAGGASVAIWLVSDMLPTGGPTVRDLLDDLSAAWGTPVTLADDTDRMTAFGRTARRESWHSGWGLPRPSLVGMAAGSCYLVCPQDEVSKDDVTRAQVEGIGLRRAEGFGRLLVAPELLDAERLTISAQIAARGDVGPQASTGEDDDSIQTPDLADADEPAWLATVRREATLRVIEDAAYRVAAAEKPLLPASLSRAQAGALRQVASGLTDTAGRASAESWLSGTKASTTRSSAWGATLDWVEATVTRDKQWKTLGAALPSDDEMIAIGGSSWKDSYRQDATRLLLLAALHAHSVGQAGDGGRRDADQADEDREVVS